MRRGSLLDTAWAFATLGQLDGKPFAALVKEAQLRGNKCDAQHIVNTAWAFATLGQLDEKQSTVLAKEAQLRSGG